MEIRYSDGILWQRWKEDVKPSVVTMWALIEAVQVRGLSYHNGIGNRRHECGSGVEPW